MENDKLKKNNKYWSLIFTISDHCSRVRFFISRIYITYDFMKGCYVP